VEAEFVSRAMAAATALAGELHLGVDSPLFMTLADAGKDDLRGIAHPGGGTVKRSESAFGVSVTE